MNVTPSSQALVPASASDVERMLQVQFQGETLSPADARALSVVQQALARQQEEERKLAVLLSLYVPNLGVTAQYRSDLNLFTGEAYTSLAGNTYLSALRLAPGIAIKSDFGFGWARMFLNGISLYSTDGRRKLLARRNFHCFFYSEEAEREACLHLVVKVILDMLSEEEKRHSHDEVMRLATAIVDSAFNRYQLETLAQSIPRQFISGK